MIPAVSEHLFSLDSIPQGQQRRVHVLTIRSTQVAAVDPPLHALSSI